MKIRRLELVRHGGALTERGASARQSWHERAGLLVRLEDESGRSGFGEASPLPGYSPDDLDGCERALRAFDLAALGEPDRLGDALYELPAARHALETALWDLTAQRAGEPLWALLARAAGPRPTPTLLPLAALIDGDDTSTLVRRAESAVGRGVRTLKLKLGRHPFEDELAAALALRRSLGRAIELRFDVNGAWATSDARERLERLASVRPELVEESAPIAELAELGAATVPLALDESLQGSPALSELERIAGRCRLVALVLKPMALGGFTRCLALSTWARARGIDVIVSHLYDGPVALAAAAHLALAVGSADRAAGLAPHAGLSAWPALHVPHVRDAHVIADDHDGLGVEAHRLAA